MIYLAWLRRGLFILLSYFIISNGNGSVWSRICIVIFLLCILKTLSYMIKGMKVILSEGIWSVYEERDDYKPKRAWGYVAAGFLSIIIANYLR